jgi:hypothetical protein
MGVRLTRAWLLAATLANGACSVGDLDLAGRDCPCVDGYVCDTVLNECVPRQSRAPDGGVDGSDGAADRAAFADSGDSNRPGRDARASDGAMGPGPDVRGSDVGPESGAVGSPCTSNSACTSGICADTALLSSLVSTGFFCTETCCNSETCPAGFVCASGGSSGTYCVPATNLGRAAPGVAIPGGECAGDTDCRSGKCQAGLCLDTCCADSGCASPTICALDVVDNYYTFVCETHGGGGDGEPCEEDSLCASGYCNVGSEPSGCTFHCCGTGCGATPAANTLGTFCVVVGESLNSTTGSFTVCALGDGPGFGSTCSVPGDCGSDTCDPSTGTCTFTCCTDSDCAPYPGFVCRPSIDPSRSLLCTRP